MYNGPLMLRALWRQGTQGPCAVLLVLMTVLGAGGWINNAYLRTRFDKSVCSHGLLLLIIWNFPNLDIYGARFF